MIFIFVIGIRDKTQTSLLDLDIFGLIFIFCFFRSIKMANIRFYLLSVLLAFAIAMVIAEPLPEGEPEGEPESGAEPEAGANAEPEHSHDHNSVSHAQAHILTAFASFIAFVLLK